VPMQNIPMDPSSHKLESIENVGGIHQDTNFTYRLKIPFHADNNPEFMSLQSRLPAALAGHSNHMIPGVLAVQQ
jgi:hypothetical protein